MKGRGKKKREGERKIGKKREGKERRKKERRGKRKKKERRKKKVLVCMCARWAGVKGGEIGMYVGFRQLTS